ncbi:hypothetical protein DIPPA_16124 [Diplonema papillatum]|nr:hypothetical protein DIPPA_16124 [Diplonema papillatum]
MTAVLSGRATARQFAEVFGGAVWATDILAVPRCHFAALLSFAGRLGGRMVDAAAPVWDEVVDVPPSARRELGALRKIVRENPWVVGSVPEDTGNGRGRGRRCWRRKAGSWTGGRACSRGRMWAPTST